MGNGSQDLARNWRTQLAAVTAVTAIWYLGWRATTFNPDALIFSALVYLAELFSFLTLAMFVFMVWDIKPPPPAQVSSHHTVDVFVATYNEDPELLRKTLIGCSRIRYRHTTWVLDDGRRPEVAALARELGCEYLTRPDNTDAKAGNLNNALANTSGDFIVTLDADHIPLSHILDVTLGYFEENPKLAFVQLPQTFYNLDSIQHRIDLKKRTMWEDQSLFFQRIQVGKNRWNSAFYCGCPAVIRREALESIGGFQTGSVTEDLHTSLALHRFGWDSLFLPQTVAYGQAAPEPDGFQKQRRRWGLGAMQVFRKSNPLSVPGLTLPQRINYFASMITYFEGLQKSIFYLAPVITLVTRVLPINSFGREFFIHFVPYFTLSLMTYRVFAGGWGRFLLTEQYNLLRFHAFFTGAIAGLYGQRARFQVTSKRVRGIQTRAEVLAPQLAMAGISLAGIGVGIYFSVTGTKLPLAAYLTALAWAGFNLFIAIGILAFSFKKAYHRAEFRFPEEIPTRFVCNGKTDFGVTLDLNATGMLLQTEAHLENGQSLSLTLFTPGRTLHPVAIVRTPARLGHAGLWRYGLQIATLSVIDHDYLSMLLLEYSMPKLMSQLRPARTPELFEAFRRRLRGQYSHRAERLHQQFLVEFEYPPGQERLAVTDDLSATGMAIFTEQEIPSGSRLRFTLHRGPEPDSLVGEVIRTRSQLFDSQALHRAAVRFTTALPEQKPRSSS